MYGHKTRFSWLETPLKKDYRRGGDYGTSYTAKQETENAVNSFELFLSVPHIGNFVTFFLALALHLETAFRKTTTDSANLVLRGTKLSEHRIRSNPNKQEGKRAGDVIPCWTLHFVETIQERR